MKYTFLFAFALLLFTCTDAERSALPTDGDLVNPTALPSAEIVAFTAAQTAELARNRGLGIVTVDDTEVDESPARWSDDPEGKTYGVVKCSGRLGVVGNGDGSQVGIGCFDRDGNLSSSGAHRPKH